MEEITSVQVYLDLIEKFKKELSYTTTNGFYGIMKHEFVNKSNFIYRGHGDYKNYKLVPGLYRYKKLNEGSYVGLYMQREKDIISDFISEGVRFVSNRSIDNIFMWLEIAQHFGVPTRLLDFTTNPLVALYFACAETKDQDKDGCIWLLDEYSYNKKFYGNIFLDGNTVENIEREIFLSIQEPTYQNMPITPPIIIKPNYTEERMERQSSMFVVLRNNRLPLDTIVDDEKILFAIKIPRDCKVQILNQLYDLGIDEKFIFPGLDGVGKYINRKYSS